MIKLLYSPGVISKNENNKTINSPRVIINATIMANKKWKNITRGKQSITRGKDLTYKIIGAAKEVYPV